MLACARGQSRESVLQQLCLGDRTARAAKILEQLGRFENAEWLRRCSTIEKLECSFASIAVSARNAMKFAIADFRSVLQRAEDYRPTHLQYPRITLCKWSSGEISSHNPKLPAC